MTAFHWIVIFLTLVPIVGTILYHVFVVGKVFTSIGASMTALGTAVTNLDKTFTTTVSNLEKTFNLQLENLSKNFEAMQKTQEKFAEVINDIVIKQMREMDKDITKAVESSKSAHHRLDCLDRVERKP